MQTRLTDMLGIEHPVMLAGMGGVSYHRLVAAVSEAGGFGMPRRVDDDVGDEMVDEIRAAQGADRQAVRRRPARPRCPTACCDDVEALIARGRVACSSPGLGVPRDVDQAVPRRTTCSCASMCGKVRHAIAAVEAGCDFVVAQGTEAGGHTGTVATMPLVPQIVDAVGDRVPVVAAGGIFDGRGLAAALALGADGVWVGTRFIATPEARSAPGYKDALLAHRRRRHRRSAGRSPARRCARSRNEHDAALRGAPRGARAVPASR